MNAKFHSPRNSLNISLSPELRTELKLSLQQMLFVELLPLNKIELVQELQHRIQQNPLVEEVEGELSSELKADSEQISGQSQETEDFKLEETDVVQLTEKTDIDWDMVIDDYLQKDYSSPKSNQGSAGFELVFDLAAESASLEDYLLLQLHTTVYDQDEIEIGERIIDNIDADGYLSIHPADLATIINESLDKVQKVLQIIQQFDPPGIASMDIRESLITQLIKKGHGDASLPLKLLREVDLNVIINRDQKKIKKILGISDDQIEQAFKQIKKLNPRPAAGCWGEVTQSVKPDFIVKIENDQLKLYSLWNDIEIPQVKINLTRDIYKKILAELEKKLENHLIEPKDIKEFKANFAEAHFLKNISKFVQDRDYSLNKVVREIIFIQEDFLKNQGELHPLTYKDVAKRVELHPSTVGRVVQNKYIQTPRGFISLRKLFSTGLGKEGDQETSSATVRSKIKEIVESEPHHSPFSDEQIVSLLAKQGFHIARRTVAKYRKIEGILPSRWRKKYD
ncbi:MAG: hypothetical protein APR63_02760 [Desulfuromonas sp. SDB]|nr:MAG: hypothetical protein APR63_02760 [Desulfuromonas sp. SDB]